MLADHGASIPVTDHPPMSKCEGPLEIPPSMVQDTRETIRNAPSRLQDSRHGREWSANFPSVNHHQNDLEGADDQDATSTPSSISLASAKGKASTSPSSLSISPDARSLNSTCSSPGLPVASARGDQSYKASKRELGANDETAAQICRTCTESAIRFNNILRQHQGRFDIKDLSIASLYHVAAVVENFLEALLCSQDVSVCNGYLNFLGHLLSVLRSLCSIYQPAGRMMLALQAAMTEPHRTPGELRNLLKPEIDGFLEARKALEKENAGCSSHVDRDRSESTGQSVHLNGEDQNLDMMMIRSSGRKHLILDENTANVDGIHSSSDTNLWGKTPRHGQLLPLPIVQHGEVTSDGAPISSRDIEHLTFVHFPELSDFLSTKSKVESGDFDFDSIEMGGSGGMDWEDGTDAWASMTTVDPAEL